MENRRNYLDGYLLCPSDGKRCQFAGILSYREIQDKENDFLFQAEGLVQKQLEMAQHNDYLDKRDFVSFSYKGHTIYDPWIREDMQGEPFAWSCMKI